MTIRIAYEATQGGADAALAKSLTKSYPYVWNVQVGICDVFACDFVTKILLNVSETGMSTTINLPDLDMLTEDSYRHHVHTCNISKYFIDTFKKRYISIRNVGRLPA
jgi:hypothetical protein